MIVEDDAFKYEKIKKLVFSVIDSPEIIRFDCVYDTIVYLQDNSPDKIILDMSLPSHTQRVGEGNPLPMPAGGIEIILELKSIKKNNIPIIIITQYPDIEIENDYFSIIEAGEEISNAYGIIDISAVLYEESSDNWKNKTTEFLNKI